MLLSSSPRKTVPLAPPGDWEPGASSSKPSSITKRIFFCGVVVENEGDVELSEDVRELVSSLGDPLGLSDVEDLSPDAEGNSGTSVDNENRTRRRAMTNTTAIQDVINELVSTERSYVRRLRILKHDYADPLRTYARTKQTAIIPAYEANTLFGNVDALLPVNEAFLQDLENMVTPSGSNSIANIGDVVLKHFKQQPGRGFELYKHFYVKREEAQNIFEREVAKKGSFATFIDRIKYSSGDAKNRIGLRELLMEPVQRIPRYTLMFRTMIKRMAPSDPQRAKLVQADEIASKIALAEADEPTKRASVMHCLTQTIEGFPPGLISHSRQLIDCIDVDDSYDGQQGPLPPGALEPLRCTLFLFDDKIMIVKRPADKTGRALSGLERLEKGGKSGGLTFGLKRNGLSCRGVVDLSDTVATEIGGGAEFHLYLENPPQDQPDRWSNRPFRSLSVVHPPAPPNFNPTKTASDKKRFLENLWKAQVDLRTRSGNSVTLQADERQVESKSNSTTVARTYFHIFQRTSFLKEAKKTKVVVQIDSSGTADPFPFGMEGPPYVVIRVQPMQGYLSRYTVTSSDPDEEDEVQIVQNPRVPDSIIQTIHQYGLFKFHTGKNSIPSTPTAASRARSGIFGLDALSRNLLAALPGSSKGDYGSSINGSRRSKSTARSSVYSQGSDWFSQRSNHTGSTSVTSVDDESFSSNKSSNRSKKLLKTRSKSPLAAGGEPGSSSRPHSRAGSVSREQSPAPPDVDEDETFLQQSGYTDASEWDLAQRLELARRNSRNQHNDDRPPPEAWEPPEDTIYEEMPPAAALRPPSRASTSTAAHSRRSTTPQPHHPITPVDHLDPPARTPSRNSERPRGPRSPSPLPSGRRTPSPQPPLYHSQYQPPSPLPPLDNSNMERVLDAEIQRMTSPPPRLSLEPTETVMPHTPPRAMKTSTRSTEPLSIKKRDSVNDGSGHQRKIFTKSSPLAKGRVVSPRRVSPLVKQAKAKLPPMDVDTDQIIAKNDTAKEELEGAQRAVKRIKLEGARLRSSLQSEGTSASPHTPRAAPLRPQRERAATTAILTKAQQERMEEMRQLIQKRKTDLSTPTRRTFGTPLTPSTSNSSFNGASRSSSGSPAPESPDVIAQSVEDAASEADRYLLHASAAQDELGFDLALLAADLKEKAILLDKARVELQTWNRKYEVLKSLLSDAVAENALVYDTVNDELEELFRTAQMPEPEAWAGMAEDVRKTKAARNQLAIENTQLKRRLTQVEAERDEYCSLLRSRGLLS